MTVDDSTTPSPLIAAPTRPISVERRSVALAQVNRTRSRLAFLWEWTKIFQVSVLLFLLIRTFFVEAFKIPSGSMEGTLLVGDFLLVNKAVYGAEVPFTGKHLPAIEQPKHGDVIVFEWPEDRTKNFIKRVIGLPGDHVQVKDGRVLVNGHELLEPYLRAQTFCGGQWCDVQLGADEYFVMGDNRPNSSDSRLWGPVSGRNIIGKTWLIYLPVDHFGPAPNQAPGMAEAADDSRALPTPSRPAPTVPRR